MTCALLTCVALLPIYVASLGPVMFAVHQFAPGLNSRILEGFYSPACWIVELSFELGFTFLMESTFIWT